jgi:uncharacterized membrane protein
MDSNSFKKQQKLLMHDDPENWRWGIFYFNRKDARLLVPKRNPALGCTLNFGNYKTYIMLLLVAAIIMAALQIENIW